MAICYIALGANLSGPYGPPEAGLEAALGQLAGPATGLVARSGLYRSAAWPDPTDPAFVNAVARVQTDLPPETLLADLHALEARFGRRRTVANAPRPLDLDLLDYDGMVSAPGAVPALPHPRLQDRAFVLLPLREVAPDWHHPVTGASIAALIEALPDPAAAWPIDR